MVWAADSSIWPRKFTTGSYRQLNCNVLAGTHTRPAKLLTACLPVWLPVHVLLSWAVPTARASTAQLRYASPAGGWTDLCLLLPGPHAQQVTHIRGGARSSITNLSPSGDQTEPIFSCTRLFLWSLSPHTTLLGKEMSQVRWLYLSSASDSHSFPAQPFTTQCSPLKLIQGPYLLLGKKGSKYAVQYGGAAKERQVMINQYQNTISVPMKLKSAISLSQAVKNLYLKRKKSMWIKNAELFFQAYTVHQWDTARWRTKSR